MNDSGREVTAPDLISCQRHLFDIPDDIAYLNCAYMSPLMHAVREAGERGVRRKCRPWEIFPADFFTEVEAARSLFAHLIGAAADDVAMIPAASYGLALAAANLPLGRGQEILLPDEQFPSNVYVWRELARRQGGAVRTVPCPGDDDWSGALLAAINGETAIVAASHCHWTNGALFDLEAIGARCREVGAALVIDATQSLGALPLDVSAVRPDFLVAATYKWLLGPYCLGFCYVAPHRQHGEPLEHNWIARRGSEDFAGLVDYQDSFQSGARRYDVGERGNFHLVPMAIESLTKLIDWGPAKIQQTLRARTDEIAARASQFGLGTLPRERRAGHFLGLRVPGGVSENLTERLLAEQVYVSVRGTESVRITPHLWVDNADIDKFFKVLKNVI